MQPMVVTNQYGDLYRFLSALAEARHNLNPDTLAPAEEAPAKLLVWSPEASSALLDSYEKLEVVEKYARKLNLQLVLSAAGNHQLRQWGRQVGWEVLWDFAGLEETAAADFLVNRSFEGKSKENAEAEAEANSEAVA